MQARAGRRPAGQGQRGAGTWPSLSFGSRVWDRCPRNITTLDHPGSRRRIAPGGASDDDAHRPPPSRQILELGRCTAPMKGYRARPCVRGNRKVPAVPVARVGMSLDVMEPRMSMPHGKAAPPRFLLVEQPLAVSDFRQGAILDAVRRLIRDHHDLEKSCLAKDRAHANQSRSRPPAPGQAASLAAAGTDLQDSCLHAIGFRDSPARISGGRYGLPIGRTAHAAISGQERSAARHEDGARASKTSCDEDGRRPSSASKNAARANITSNVVARPDRRQRRIWRRGARDSPARAAMLTLPDGRHRAGTGRGRNRNLPKLDAIAWTAGPGLIWRPDRRHHDRQGNG